MGQGSPPGCGPTELCVHHERWWQEAELRVPALLRPLGQARFLPITLLYFWSLFNQDFLSQPRFLFFKPALILSDF